MKSKIIIRNATLRNRAAELIQGLSFPLENAVATTTQPTEVLHEVVIRPYKSKRSLDQNAYLHKLLADISDFTGDSLESTKLQMKIEFLEPKARHELPSGDIYVTYPSTADMNVKELCEFCERIEAFAMNELGFIDNSYHDR